MTSLSKQDLTTICGCVIFVMAFKKKSYFNICTCEHTLNTLICSDKKKKKERLQYRSSRRLSGRGWRMKEQQSVCV